MPSPESKRLRATLVNDRTTVGTPVETLRREWEAAVRALSLPSNIAITAVDAGGVPAERIECADTPKSPNLIVWLHGGGFNSGSCKTHRDLAARMARAAATPVLTVDYRLAPEFPCPAAVEDAATAYRWLLRSGFSAEQIAIAGDSAGGGLAVAVLAKLRDEGVAMPAAVALMSPWVDLAHSGDSLQSRADVDPLTSQEGLQEAAGYYLGDRDPRDPLASPLYAELRGLPPMLIHVGDHEVLLSDATRLAEKARQAGVEVQIDVWDEMWHCWHAWSEDLPEARDALAQMAQFIRRRLTATPLPDR